MGVLLSAELREATATAHENAEESAFVTELMQGQRDAHAFKLLTAQYLVLYRAMETSLRTHYSDNPLVAAVDDRRLDRTEALEADLEHLTAGAELPIAEATRRYAHMLTEEHTPERIVANHYVRYLGDLSGGQAIAALVARHYGIAPEGLSFYRFPGIEKMKVYKDEYRAKLDALNPDPATRERLVQAAIEAFAFNQAIFVDLAALDVREPVAV